MKKFVLCAAAFVAAFASCSKPETDVQIPDSEEKVWVEFTTGAMTKVTREDVNDDPEIKHKFVWEENDEVTISGETFKALQSGDKVSFGAEVEPSFLNIAAHNAIYPGSAGSSFDSINIEDTYESVPESGFYGIYAVASSETQSLQFKHLTSLVKFQIPADYEVSTITISADEPLAGKVSVEMNEGTPVVTVLDAQGVNTITLSGEFESGKDYYVPVIAGAKTNLIVNFDGKVSKEWATVTLNQGRVANMSILPAPLTKANIYVLTKDIGWTSVNMVVDTKTTPMPTEKIGDYTYYKAELELNQKYDIVFNNGGTTNSHWGVEYNDLTLNDDIYLRLAPKGAVVINPNDKKTFGYSIYVFDQKSKNVAPNLYVWDDSDAFKNMYGGNFSNWPGVAFKKDCYYKPADLNSWRHYYYYDIPTSLYGRSFNFIINKKDQTADINIENLDSDLYVGYWYDNANSNGFWLGSEPYNTPITQ